MQRHCFWLHPGLCVLSKLFREGSSAIVPYRRSGGCLLLAFRQYGLALLSVYARCHVVCGLLLRFAVFTFRETPKYLLYKGEDAKAIATMQHIAKVNRQQCRLTIEDFQALEPNGCSEEVTSSDLLIPGQKGISLVRESSIKFRRWLERYKMLFDGFQMTRLTILV